jgi:hypothetical protein
MLFLSTLQCHIMQRICASIVLSNVYSFQCGQVGWICTVYGVQYEAPPNTALDFRRLEGGRAITK